MACDVGEVAAEASGGELPAPPEDRPGLALGGAVALAVAVWAGAATARPVPLVVVAALVAGAFVVRHPAPVIVAAGLVASLLGARAEAGLAPPPPGEHRGTVTLVTDPDVRFGQVRAVVRAGSERWQAEADGAAGEVLRTRLAGERVEVIGWVGSLPPGAEWLAVQHVSGRLRLTDASPGPPAAPPWRMANRLRRLLVAGAQPLSADRRTLYAGLVLGDDRGQPPTLVDDFRGAGLSHLLAVSGQNVAFVLALVGPALRRLRLGPRLVATLSALALFACTTRFEPSVLRAVVMAGVAAVGVAWGRRVAGPHALALTVGGLVLVDPLLVRSVGFRLSVAASAGILLLAVPIAAALPGPRAIALPLAVTLAAQIAVAPLLVAEFDGVPVASVPANLLAGAIAGLVMMWGLVVGLIAGAVGPPGDAWLQWPVDVALGWIERVAAVSARAPLGEITAPGAVGALVATGLTLGAVRLRPSAARLARWVAAVVAAGVLVSPALLLAGSGPPRHEPVDGLVIWRSGGATLVDVTQRPSPADVLAGLRRAGVRRIDLLVAPAGTTGGGLVETARHRAPVGRVWRVGDRPGATAPGERWRAGGLDATVGQDGRLAVMIPGGDPERPG